MTDSETDCPICLIHVPLLVTPCGHKACQNCFERVLLTTSPSHNYSNMTDEYPLNNVEQFEDVIIYSCPSKGRCPLCRKFIDLFDLKQCDEEGKPAGDGYKKMHDVWNSPLAGLSFGTREGDMVVQFPAADDELPSMLMLDIDTGETERELKFEDGFHYHEKSKMFLGHIDSTKVVEGREVIAENWEWIMQFSSDFRYVIHGARIKRPPVKPGQIFENNFKEYPLEGRWRFRHQTRAEAEQGADMNSNFSLPITVHGHSFELLGLEYDVRLGNADESRVHFYCSKTGGMILSVAESGVDLTTQPEGPNVGETIVWRSNDPNLFRIFWTRESKENFVPRVRVVQFGHNGELLIKRHDRQTVKPSYNRQSPWGNVFIQLVSVGVASYHFISPDGVGEKGVYISYEHVRCSDWPPLDDGSLVPARVPFVNISYNTESRTFRGTIPWLEAYGTCWQGNSSWIYEIVFDSEFLCILSGGVTMSSTNDRTALHPEERSSTYGDNLNYINAAIVDRTKDHLSEDDDPSDESIRDSILDEIKKIKDRLSEEDVHARTLEVLLRAARGALSTDIIDYNL